MTPQSLIVVDDRAGLKSSESSTLRIESTSSRVFVGRTHELDRLTEALQRARQGQGSAILLHGYPGIGKTRLLERFAELAVPSDAIAHTTLVWGRCWEADGRPPLWPWPEVVRGAAEQLVARTGPTALRVAAEDFEAELMQLTPELRRWLSSDDAAELGCVQEEPFSAFRMLDVISRFLLRVAGRCGRIPQAHELDDDRSPSVADPGAALVLVLEDLHLADSNALQLVEVLCKAISSVPLLLVASYRSLEGWELSVLQAAREGILPNVQSWELEGLTARDVQHWVCACLPHAPLTIGETLHRTAEGHPLMTANLIHSLLQQDEVSPPDGLQPQEFSERSVSPFRQIPERIAQSFRRRFATLPSPELELLQAASVFGDEALLSLLAQVTRRELVDVLRLLRRPMRQGLIRQENNSMLRFSHALVREVLYRDLDPGRRFSLHAAVGQSMAERLAIHPSWLMQVAHHYMQAAPGRRMLRHARAHRGRHRLSARRHYHSALNANEHRQPFKRLKELLRERGVLYPPFSAEDVYIGGTTAFLLLDLAKTSSSDPNSSKKVILTGHASHDSTSSDSEWSNYVSAVDDWITTRNGVCGVFAQSDGWDPGFSQLRSLANVYRGWSATAPETASDFDFPKVRVSRKSSTAADNDIGFFATMLNSEVFGGKEFINHVGDTRNAAEEFELSGNVVDSFLTTMDCLMQTLRESTSKLP